MKKAPKSVNDPNKNYAMYEQDRVAKSNAQPKLPKAGTGEGNALRVTAEERTKQERFYCPDCNRSHHIFNFGPSSTRKIAICGRSYPLIHGE